MELNYQSLISQYSQFIWPLPRITSLFLTMPVLSTKLIPVRIKLVFSLAFALICAPFISENLSFLNFKPVFIGYLFNEILLGVLMGFILQMVFQVFVIGGQIIAMQAGLGFATMVDPASRASVPLISQFYLIMISLLFLALNGHLAIFDALISSFHEMPVGTISSGLSAVGSVIAFSGWMMKESVLIALPAIVALLIVNLAFGVMTRVAPQLNIFSMGFPITLLMGFVIIKISIYGVVAKFSDGLMQGMHLVKGILH